MNFSPLVKADPARAPQKTSAPLAPMELISGHSPVILTAMPHAQAFQLALIQMRVEPGAKAANLARAITLIAEAAGHGANVVLLPETMPLGWMDASTPELADAIPEGEACTVLGEAARHHGVHVCAGLAERSGERVFNAAVLIDQRGDVILHHRKLNELEIAQPVYSPGDRLHVAATCWGTFGVMICADAFARNQVISRTLGYMGAEIILSPCAWAVPPDHDNAREPYGKLWRDNYGPVARDFQIWIAGVSNVGPVLHGAWRGHQCIGCSLVVNPSGEAVVAGPYGANAEAILYANIHPHARPARGAAWESHWSERSAASAHLKLDLPAGLA